MDLGVTLPGKAEQSLNRWGGFQIGSLSGFLTDRVPTFLFSERTLFCTACEPSEEKPLDSGPG